MLHAIATARVNGQPTRQIPAIALRTAWMCLIRIFMDRLVAVFVAMALVLCWHQHLRAQEATLEELVKNAVPSVPAIVCETGQYGSGFVIEHDGKLYVCTNRHVLEGGGQFNVIFLLDTQGRTAYTPQPSDLRVWRISRKADVALIDCRRIQTDLRERRIQPLPLASENHRPRLGEPVFALGHPSAAPGLVLPVSVTTGIVSGLEREVEGMRFLQTNAALNPGNSGGPLFDRQGRVIANNTLVAREAQNTNFALSLRHLYELLDDESASLSPEEIRDYLRPRQVQGRQQTQREEESDRGESEPNTSDARQPEILHRKDYRIEAGKTLELGLTLRRPVRLIVAVEPRQVPYVSVRVETQQQQVLLAGRQTRDNPPLVRPVTPGEYQVVVANPHRTTTDVRVTIAVEVMANDDPAANLDDSLTDDQEFPRPDQVQQLRQTTLAYLAKCNELENRYKPQVELAMARGDIQMLVRLYTELAAQLRRLPTTNVAPEVVDCAHTFANLCQALAEYYQAVLTGASPQTIARLQKRITTLKRELDDKNTLLRERAWIRN
ncbi:Putative serine protease HtrA [bacterium HR36]|nr:Putative serine protease HtrA [bacterium HR36]